MTDPGERLWMWRSAPVKCSDAPLRCTRWWPQDVCSHSLSGDAARWGVLCGLTSDIGLGNVGAAGGPHSRDC